MTTADLVCPKCGLECKSAGGYGKHVPACKGKQPARKAAKPKEDRIAAMHEARAKKVEERRKAKELADAERDKRMYGEEGKSVPRLPLWGGYDTMDRYIIASSWRYAGDVFIADGQKPPAWLSAADKERVKELVG